MNCLAFRCGGQDFAVLAEEISELIFLPELLRTPGLPWLLEGFLRLGLEAIPIIGLAKLFGLPPQELTDYTQILLFQGGAIGWLVDQADEVIAFEPSQLLPLAAGGAFRNCVAAIIPRPERNLHLLVSSLVLLEQERQTVEQLAHQVEARLALLEASP